MKKDVYKARRNAQKSRTLRFENLETLELLCVDLTTILSYTSGTELDDASFPNAFPVETPTIVLADPSTGASLSDGDTLEFVSYYIDPVSVNALAPSYGETTYKRLAIKNTGTNALTITSATLSEGSRVEFVGGHKSSLEPNEETILTLKWQALQAETSTLTILSDDPDQPTFELDLSGSIRANTTILPTLGSVSSATDINRTKTSDQAEVDARIACYIAYANADYAQAQTTLDAKTDSVTRKLDLLSLWSQHVVDKNWTYDTIKYGGYDSLTYSMIEPNNSNLTYAPFTGGAVTTMPTAESVGGISIPDFSNREPLKTPLAREAKMVIMNS